MQMHVNYSASYEGLLFISLIVRAENDKLDCLIRCIKGVPAGDKRIVTLFSANVTIEVNNDKIAFDRT